MKRKKSFELDEDKLLKLYDKFSSPMINAVNDEYHKAEASLVAKTLWLYLITNMDSEKNIYDILYLVVEKIPQKASFMMEIYYKIMKNSLLNFEIIQLHNHYKSPENFSKLKKWGYSQESLDMFR